MLKGLERIHYLLAILSILIIFLISSQAPNILGISVTYLIFIILITLNVWYGGIRLGLFTVIIAAIHSIIFIAFQNVFLSNTFYLNIYEITLFLIAGFLICFFIEKYKKTDIVRVHIRKEAQLQEIIKLQENESVRLQKEVKMRDEFLSIASHELKTPLTSMLLKIQMILHNIRNVSLANFSVGNLMQQLETAEGQTKRLSQMINDLLNVSLITTGKMNLEKKKEDVCEIVKEVVNEFSEKFKIDDIKVSLDIEKPVFALVDKVRIEQVVSNLISNAIKYGDKKPIEIKVRGSNLLVMLSVTDKGIGIPRDQTEKIFSLFERGSNGNKMKGLGVGLYIASQIIKAHNGKIKVKSSTNQGSTFLIEIPVK